MDTEELKQRKQAIANQLNGLTLAEATMMLKSLKQYLKHSATVQFEEDKFTKQEEVISIRYRSRLGMLGELMKDTEQENEDTQ